MPKTKTETTTTRIPASELRTDSKALDAGKAEFVKLLCGPEEILIALVAVKRPGKGIDGILIQTNPDSTSAPLSRENFFWTVCALRKIMKGAERAMQCAADHYGLTVTDFATLMNKALEEENNDWSCPHCDAQSHTTDAPCA